MPFALRFDGDGPAAVVVEEDERVCYAYFMEGGRITGDVWLYNVGETPEAPEWADRDNARPPFRNARRYVREDGVRPPADPAGVEVRWTTDGAEVLVGGELLGSVGGGQRPGRAALAAHPGPVAGVLPAAAP